MNAAHLISIRCIIKMKYFISAALLATMALAMVHCAGAKIAATDAMKRAEAAQKEMQELNVAKKRAVSYRLQMHQARDAFEKRKYKKAQQAADAAVSVAESLIKRRKTKIEKIQRQLKEFWFAIEHDAFPPRAMVEASFAAQNAFERKDYDSAGAILAKARREAALRTRITRRKTIIIQATSSYFEKNKFIPVYEKLGKGGLEGEVVARIAKAETAVFIKSKWVSPARRYVKMSISAAGENIMGWVRGEFVH